MAWWGKVILIEKSGPSRISGDQGQAGHTGPKGQPPAAQEEREWVAQAKIRLSFPFFFHGSVLK